MSAAVVDTPLSSTFQGDVMSGMALTRTRPPISSPPVHKRCKLEALTFSAPLSVTENASSTKLGGSVTGVRFIKPTDLATKLKNSKTVLMLDCRSFISFNVSHITGAVNVNCSDRISKKRLQQGKLTLVDLVSSNEGKERFKKRLANREIIVYDDNTSDLTGVPSSHPMRMVVSFLLREGQKTTVLKGGLTEFRRNYPGLCRSSVKTLPCPGPLYSPTTPLIEPQIETAVASPVLPFLYLGNERDASDLDFLRSHNINYVLNITSHIPFHFECENMNYKRLPATDSGQQNLRQYFEEAFQFIDEARHKGGNILVHCHAGVSRSATITVAYIMSHTSMAMLDAYQFVKGKRSIIAPNFNFMGQLLEFEQALNSHQVPRCLEPMLNGLETSV